MAILSLVIITIALFVTPRATGAQSIKIGMLTTLSGLETLTASGQEALNAAKLAVDEINASGGINRRKVRLVIEDDSGRPSIGQVRAQKLADQDKVVAIIGPVSSPTTYAVIHALKPRARIQIALSTRRLTRGQRPRWFFRIAPSEDKLILSLGLFVKQNLKARRVAVTFPDSPSGRFRKDIITDQFKKEGVSIISLGSFEARATDFSQLVSRAKSRKIDAVFFLGPQSQYKKFALAARKHNLSVPIVASLGLGPAGISGIAKSIPNIRGYVAGFTDIMELSTARDFVARYKAIYNTLPAVGSGITAYTAIMVLRDALAAAGGNFSTDVLAGLLAKGAFQTPLGILRFDAQGNALWAGEAIWKLEKGQAFIVKQSTGGTPCPCKYMTCCKYDSDCKKPCS